MQPIERSRRPDDKRYININKKHPCAPAAVRAPDPSPVNKALTVPAFVLSVAAGIYNRGQG